MADLQQGLVAGRGKKEANQMRKKFEECELKIKTLRNKNNELQKQCDNDLMESDIKSAIKAQTAFIENEINDLKKALEQLSKTYTDPGSKNKIKEICNQASREMQRNKRIMQEFMNRASTSPSIYKRDSAHPFLKSRSHMERDQPIPFSKQSNSIIASEDMLSEIKAEQKMLAQRTALLKQLEQKNNRINQIMNQMGEMVGGEQRDMVNQIDDNLIAVKHNMQDANNEMDEAIVYQKKSKKKYICIISTIVVILLIAFGLLYFLVIGK